MCIHILNKTLPDLVLLELEVVAVSEYCNGAIYIATIILGIL